jgi:hypothetical protein
LSTDRLGKGTPRSAVGNCRRASYSRWRRLGGEGVNLIIFAKILRFVSGKRQGACRKWIQSAPQTAGSVWFYS